ncbi:YdcF family protein [Dyella subtropica]|uniref:YdcF family protein n=1 Tax=Dyella subtropica TaxID=2992127 RepID=UPI00224EC3FF|nr:YdcF family protein [Dyella subtropica]
MWRKLAQFSLTEFRHAMDAHAALSLTSWAYWFQRIGLLAAAMGCLWMVCAVGITLAGLFTRPTPADLALVLGNTVALDNQPMPRLQARLEAALALYRHGGCGVIMVSGGIDPADGRNEAAGMKRWLIDHGVPADDVVADPFGDNTRASALHAKAWLETHGQRRAVAVSQYFHLPRARLALRQAGVEDAGGAYPRRWFARDLYSSLREVPGYLAYLLRLH